MTHIFQTPNGYFNPVEQANRDELNLLLSFYKPIFIALQETNLGKLHSINYSNYFFYSTPGT